MEDHEAWTKGQIKSVIVRTKQLSPGVTRSALKEIAPDQYTQVEKLSDAKKQVIDYLDTVDPTQNHSDWGIHLSPKE